MAHTSFQNWPDPIPWASPLCRYAWRSPRGAFRAAARNHPPTRWCRSAAATKPAAVARNRARARLRVPRRNATLPPPRRSASHATAAARSPTSHAHRRWSRRLPARRDGAPGDFIPRVAGGLVLEDQAVTRSRRRRARSVGSSSVSTKGFSTMSGRICVFLARAPRSLVTHGQLRSSMEHATGRCGMSTPRSRQTVP